MHPKIRKRAPQIDNADIPAFIEAQKCDVNHVIARIRREFGVVFKTADREKSLGKDKIAAFKVFYDSIERRLEYAEDLITVWTTVRFNMGKFDDLQQKIECIYAALNAVIDPLYDDAISTEEFKAVLERLENPLET